MTDKTITEKILEDRKKKAETKEFDDILKQMEEDLMKYERFQVRLSIDKMIIFKHIIETRFTDLEYRLTDAIHKYNWLLYDSNHHDGVIYCNSGWVYFTNRKNRGDFEYFKHLKLDEIRNLSHPNNEMCKHCDSISIVIKPKNMATS